MNKGALQLNQNQAILEQVEVGEGKRSHDQDRKDLNGKADDNNNNKTCLPRQLHNTIAMN